MRTAQLARNAGVKPATLRYYERRGLLAAPERSPSGYRCYGTEAIRVVRFVKRTQELGFTLDEVQELLHLAAGGPDSCTETRTLASGKLANLDAKIAHLTAMRDSLHRLVETCTQPRADRQCPLLDSLDTPAESTLDRK